MLQSMYSGISGMKSSNQELDVISNNIANSQTTAFKSSSVTFQDSFNEVIQQSTAPSGNKGGINAVEVGTGVNVAAINKDMGQGSTLSTGRGLDTEINGTGFFVLGTGAVSDSNGMTVNNTGSTSAAGLYSHEASIPSGQSLFYTRDGSFSLDANGNLVNSLGYKVMGYSVSGTGSSGAAVADSISGAANPDGTMKVEFVDGNKTVTANDSSLKPLVIPATVDENGTAVKVSAYSIDKNGVITATLADQKITAIGQIALASFNNDTGLSNVGSNMYSESTNSGTANFKTGVNTTGGSDNSGAYGTVQSGVLEQSNVDLATEFTHMIEASRAFQANGKIISTGDEVLQTIINLKS